MSLTRILCHTCERPLAFCDCRTLKIEEPKPDHSGTFDFKPSPVAYDTACCNTTSTPPKPKKTGRSKFFR